MSEPSESPPRGDDVTRSPAGPSTSDPGANPPGAEPVDGVGPARPASVPDPASADTPGLPLGPTRSNDPTSNAPGALETPEPGDVDGSRPTAGRPSDSRARGRFGRRSAARGVPEKDAATAGTDGRRTRPRRKAPWWELPALVILAIGIAILVKTFVVQPFYIPSDSMEHTLHGCSGCQGDRILVEKPVYDFRDPHPGDIVVFNAPPGWDDEPVSRPPANPVLRVVRGFGQLIGFVPPDGQVLVKRVIATGGQTVKGDVAGNVFISDQGPAGPYRKLVEPFVFTDPGKQQFDFGPVTVPKGRLWVMGDHRTDSADSRFHCSSDGIEGTADDTNCDPQASTVPNGDVIGKAFVIAWPPSRWRTLGTPSTFTSAAAPIAPSAVSLAGVATLALARRRRRR